MTKYKRRTGSIILTLITILLIVWSLWSLYKAIGGFKTVKAISKVREDYLKRFDNPKELFVTPNILALCNAIEKQDIVAMNKIIAKGADVNAIGKQKFKNADGDVVRVREVSVLQFSLQYGKEVVECLLKHGADPNRLLKETSFQGGVMQVSHYSILNNVITRSIPQGILTQNFGEYADILLEYGADPDWGNEPPLILVLLYDGGKRDNFVSLVEAGANLNATNSTGEKYAVTLLAEQWRFDDILYLLESGATYQTDTIPGGELQRMLFEFRRNKALVAHPNYKDNLNAVVKWLEDHGVSFDKPVPKEDSTKKPEPVRKKPKVKENV
ncbi:MAG: hypothetical protein LBU65_06845 [Planctomycetaceae bacterium]|nr:hypothetical protein [Planctomycetaceae bacterium]